MVRESGLTVNPQFPFLGTSVDGLVSCSTCGEGILEIKSPYVHRNQTPQECAADDGFCSRLVDGHLRLKDHHNYTYQVMGQMAITRKSWCDFVIFTKKGLGVQRVVFDDSWHTTMLPKLKDFYVHVFVPELFSERVKRGVPLFLI